jgi:hypothetical protein
MSLLLRQIALIVHDIEATTATLKQVFGLDVGHMDPGLAVYGLQNRLLPIGTQLLEVAAPVQPNTAGGRYLVRRGGDGGYMVICQATDHAAYRQRVATLGTRVVAGREMARAAVMQLHPQDTGGSFLEIDRHEDHDSPIPPWEHGAGHHWQDAIRPDGVSAITAAELQCDDPARTASRWSEILMLPVEGQDGADTIRLTNATLRFVPIRDSRPEGLGGLDLRTVDRAATLERAKVAGVLKEDAIIAIAGMRLRLV